ncbi:MAG: hypothetical protein I8H75_00700 [Myxococcaceae bacterium]|nr:hypothetical protein [Myxococcaceae bacterium]MBH2005861.1 hypothetical protein [Myxococcaceae bacterium]
MSGFKFKVTVLFSCTFLFVSNLLANELLPGQLRPFGWVYLGRAKPDELVRFIIYLHQPRRKEFNRLAEKISNPRSEQYGRHMSLEEIHEFLKVPESTYAELDAWFNSKGLPSSMCNKEWDHYDCRRVPVKDAEHLLQVRIGVYDYDSGQKQELMTEDEPKTLECIKYVIGIEFQGPIFYSTGLKVRRIDD